MSDIINQIQLKTFWGYGLDSYKTINGIFQSTEITSARVQNLQGAHQQYIPITIHAHTDFLQILSEIGFIGSSLIIFPIILELLVVFLQNQALKVTSQQYLLILFYYILLLIFHLEILQFPQCLYFYSPSTPYQKSTKEVFICKDSSCMKAYF